MLRIFNTLGKKLEIFRPVDNKGTNVFTCGPSVYQRSHIGNFRTFLFEDILIRYLEYSGFSVKRGMNFTDIEDKAFEEAKKRKMSVKDLTEENIKNFLREMELLKMKIPDYLPRASEAVDEAVERLLPAQIGGLDLAPVARKTRDQPGPPLGIDVAGSQLEVTVRGADGVVQPLPVPARPV